MKRLLTTEEAATYLSVSRAYMQRLMDVSGGPVRTISLGRRCRRIPVESLDAYVDGTIELQHEAH